MNVNIIYADVPGFPSTAKVDHIHVAINDSTGTTIASQDVPESTSTVTFTQVFNTGTYSFSVSALDSAGTTLGTPVVGTFDVQTPTTISLSLPQSVTVSLS